MYKKLVVLLGLSLPTVQLYANCPAGDEGHQSGCLIVEENYQEPNENKIQIFYQWVGIKDNKKPTIVMLNGGPGGSLIAYRDTIKYQALQLNKKYNVLLYDQRGIGRSSQINEQNVSTLDLSLYMTDSHVEDLAQLVNKVIRKRPIVMGHSYGGMLAFAFATKYPQKVQKLIALNGSSDSSGIIALNFT